MKTILKLILPLLIVATITSCNENEDDDIQFIELQIQLKFDNDIPSAIDNIEVLATNNQNGQIYSSKTNKNGVAILNIEPGLYTLSSQYVETINNVTHIYNGLINDYVISESMTTDIQIVSSQTSQLIIKEIYYTGCVGANGSNYFNDQYLIIYNNSECTAYLDSLCVAQVYPTRATSKSAFTNASKYQFVPAFNFAWMFPGSGHDYPIEPGQEIVVAPNCINHIELGNTNSVDLSRKGYWACYSNTANLSKQSAPATPDKLMLNLIWKDEGLSCICSLFDPAFIIWRIQGDFDKFMSTALVLNPEQPSSKKQYMAVPNEWIYDGVECFCSTKGNKRLPSVIDNGAIINEKSIGSGTSVIRVIDEEATASSSIKIYKDTNNSTDDFIVSTPSLKD